MSEVVKTVAYSKSVDVLSFLNEGPKRFTDIGTELGLNPNIVNRRLKDLREAGLAEKAESGEYRLTSKGQRALELVEQLRALR